MVHHFLVCFDRETARAPLGIEGWKSMSKPHPRHPAEVPEECPSSTRAALERAYSASRPESRHMQLLGHGNGFSFEATPFCSTASRNGVHVLLAGEVSQWPGIDAVQLAHNAFVSGSPPPEPNDASWLLDFYSSFIDTDDVVDAHERALECLEKVCGSFAFVIFDSASNRVYAARDADGAQPLYWGATEEGSLLFGSSLEELEGCDPTATLFPAGTMFMSERHALAYSPGDRGWVIADGDWPGQLLSFVRLPGGGWRPVRAIPRLTPQGCVCGAVYKVASARDLGAGAGVQAL